MSYRRDRPQRRGRGCLVTLVVLVWLVVLAGLAYRYWLGPQISAMVGEQIGRQVGAPPAPLGQQLEQQAQDALPTVVAALPAGELRISEAQANAYLQANRASLKPLDSVTVRFVPGEIQADLGALGTTSTASLGLAAQDGQIVVTNPRISGLVGQAISAQDLARSLERQINQQLAGQGRRVSDVRIEQGVLVIRVDG